MPDLRQTRKNLTTAIAIMVGFDLLAAVLYFSPLIGSAESRRQDLNRLQADLTVKTREVAPLKDLPHKVVVANQQIADFYKKRFPSQNSQIYAEFGKLAAANGVRIESVRYKPDTEGSTLEGLQAAEMDADLAGTYTSLARFINALERDEMFFIINTVTLDNDPRGPVKLSVRLETYLKAGTT
jgi:type IV pilus assembly protein PilO